jgi:uncharacterized spore protein YtfJ
MSIIEKLSEQVPGWGVTLAYGEKITVDGHELVPVALAGFGFGAGEGDTNGGDGPEGSGGGGGGWSIPVGAYVAGPAGPKFQPNLIALIAVAVPALCIMGRALPKIIKAAKR